MYLKPVEIAAMERRQGSFWPGIASIFKSPQDVMFAGIGGMAHRRAPVAAHYRYMQ